MRLSEVVDGLSRYLLEGITTKGGWGAEPGKFKEANPLNTGEVLCGLIATQPYIQSKDVKLFLTERLQQGVNYLINTQLKSGGWATGSAYMSESIDTRGNIVSTCWSIWALCDYFIKCEPSDELCEEICNTINLSFNYLDKRIDSLWAYSPDLKEINLMATSYGMICLSQISNLICKNDSILKDKIPLLKAIVFEATDCIESSVIKKISNEEKGKESCFEVMAMLLLFSINELIRCHIFKSAKEKFSRISEIICDFLEDLPEKSTYCCLIERQTVVEAGKKARDFIHYTPVWMLIAAASCQHPNNYNTNDLLEIILSNIDPEGNGASYGSSKRFTWSTALTLLSLGYYIENLNLNTIRCIFPSVKESRQSVDPKKIFVVHGRNHQIRNSMFTFLRSLGLSPIEWEEAILMTRKGSPHISQILDVAFATAQAIIILLSGDDEARLKEEYQTENEHEITFMPQSRPNVIFEAGLAFGRNPDRTIIVQIGDHRPFSDIAGHHIIKFSGTAQDRQKIALRLETAGCEMQKSTDWITAGDFFKKP